MRGITIIFRILQIKKQGRFRKRGENSKWGQIFMTNTRKGQIRFLMQTIAGCILKPVDRKWKDLRTLFYKKTSRLRVI